LELTPSTFQTSLNNDFTSPTPFMVYMASPGIPGGFASAILLPTAACDVNQNSNINVSDVQKILNEALGVEAPANDLSHSGMVNVLDVQVET